MVISRIALLILVSSPFLSAQDFSAFLVNEEGDPLNDIVIAQLDDYVWMSSEDGTLFLPDTMVEISLHSLLFRDTSLYVHSRDTITMKFDETSLKQIDVFGNIERKSVRHRRCRGEYQREPGDIRLLGYYADDLITLDSLEIRVVEVLRPTARFKVVIFNPDTEEVFSSHSFQLNPSLEDDEFIMPIHFKSKLKGEFYLGIQFLEEGRDAFNWVSHLYQNRRRGLYTIHNNGVTLGSIRLKSGERMMTAEFFNGGKVHWWTGSGNVRRYRAPYMKVYYHGPGELLTDFDDIED